MRYERHERWRRLLKSVTAAAICRAHGGALPAALGLRRLQPLIIGYHRVVEDFSSTAETDMPTMLVSRVMFERHLEWLGRHFRFVSLDESGEQVLHGVPFSQPVAAITFDDGYRDVYENGVPILKRKGVPAAVFVVTGLVGRSCWQTHDRLYSLMAKAYAAWNDPRTGLMGLLAGMDMSTPAACSVGIGKREPPLRRKPRYFSTSPPASTCSQSAITWPRHCRSSKCSLVDTS